MKKIDSSDTRLCYLV